MSDHKRKGSKTKFEAGGFQEKVNLNERLDEVMKLIDDTRLIAAEQLYKSLLSYIHSLESNSTEANLIKQRLSAEKVTLEMMMERVALAKEAIATSADVDEDSDWIYAVTLFGVTTHYKVQDDGSLILRMQGSREDLPLFEQLAVVHEVDLYPTWVPFCNEAKMMTKITHSDLIAYFNMQMLMFSRDAAVRFYGVDCLFEEGIVVLLGHSIDSWESPAIPFKTTGLIHDRMIFKEFKAIVKLESPIAAKIVVIASIDPRAPVPHFFRNLILQKLAGVIVYCMQSQAQKIVEDPMCEHGRRILHNKEFFAEWLLPKFRAYCDYMRWEQPTIAALGPAGIPLGGRVAAPHPPTPRESGVAVAKETSSSTKKADAIAAAAAGSPGTPKPRRVVRFAQVVEEIDVDPAATNALVTEAIAIFREKNSLFDALDYLVSKNFIVVKPQNIAGFLLRYGAKFDEGAVGDLLGEDINMDDEGLLWSEVRYKFVRAAYFIEMDVESALRKFFTECGFKMPSDGARVERLVGAFVRVFWEDNNKTPFAPFDQMANVQALVVAIISLNTNYHGPNSDKSPKMTEDAFLNSMQLTAKVLDVNRKYISSVYRNVTRTALDDTTLDVSEITLEEAQVERVEGAPVPELVQQAVRISMEKHRKPMQNALRFLVNKQFISDSPKDVAKFMLTYRSLFDPMIVGEMLGEEGKTKEDKHRCSQLRYFYIRASSFVEMSVENALRKFLSSCGFRLPTDGLKIDCLVGTFVRVFWEDNKGTSFAPFKHMDTIHLLVLAIILLDGDLHNPETAAGEKMTKEMFIGDLHGVDRDKNNTNDKPSDISPALLSQIFDNVKSRPLNEPVDSTATNGYAPTASGTGK